MDATTLSRHLQTSIAAMACMMAMAFVSPVSASEPLPPCDGEFIPRIGSEIGVTNPWITVTGPNTAPITKRGETGTVTGPDDRQVEGTLDALESPESHRTADNDTGVFGLSVQDLDPGTYEWTQAGASGEFTVADDASHDEAPPSVGDGELVVEEKFEDMSAYYDYRRGEVWGRMWRLQLPVGDDDSTATGDLRYLITTTPVDAHEPLGQMLLTPSEDEQTNGRVSTVLRNYQRHCHHPLPAIDDHSELRVIVHTVDLAGNVSDDYLTTEIHLGDPPDGEDDPPWRDIRAGAQAPDTDREPPEDDSSEASVSNGEPTGDDSSEAPASDGEPAEDDSPSSGCGACTTTGAPVDWLIILVIVATLLLLLKGGGPLRRTAT